MAWIVEMQRWVPRATWQVTNGLPLTMKNRRFEEGKSTVILRSLTAEIKWGFGGFSGVEMVRSEMKDW